MNILVTGGAGYIGSITAEQLLTYGHHVSILDDLSSGHRAAVPAEAHFIQGDIADQTLVTGLLEQHNIDAVMHFAAYSLVGKSMREPLRYFHNNSAKTLTLLDTMLTCGVQRFVLSSTAALFGTPEKLPISEITPISPESVYGESKYLIERMLRWLSETAGLGYVTLRYFNAAGASAERGEDHRPESHLVPLMLQVALGQRDHIAIFGDDYPTPDGTCIRDYLHVLDLAKAHVLAVEALQPGEQHAYNLGNGQGFSVREVLKLCREVSNHPIPATLAPRRAGDPAALIANSQRIKDALGWQPEYQDLKSIITSAWNWHQAHPHGYGAAPSHVMNTST